MEFDISKTVQEIVMQAKETQEDFIIETIYPYCEDILQIKINKEELKQMLLKSMQSPQPCDDCVSREAVEKITWEEPSYDDALNVLTEVRDKVKALPPVKPQRPKGRWLDKKMTIKGAHGMTYGRYACSVCKKKFPNKSNYCPNCGADMSKAFDEFFNGLPNYVTNEMKHPNKKPRGSIRRRRKEKGGDDEC